MPKKTRLPMGAVAATHHPGFKAGGSVPWQQEFYIRPSSDEANEKIAKVLMRSKEDIAEYERCMELPGYDEKQNVYAVKKAVMDDLDKNQSIHGDYKAFVRYHENGKLYRHRTPEQLAKAKARRARKDLKRTRPHL